MLSRAIMAPRDLIIDTAEAQRMALFFDHILIWSLERDEFSEAQDNQFSADFEYLREQGVAIKCGLNIPNFFSFGATDGTAWSPFEDMSKDCDLLLPFQMGTGVPQQAENEKHADLLVRHLSSQLIYNESPVVAHATPTNLGGAKNELNTIEVVLKNIPLPPENIPWEDFIQFRNEEENIAKLRALRLWLQQRATSQESPRAIQEQLEHLLYEYQKYMEIQHKKYSQGVLSTLISSTPEIVSSLITLNFGAALKSIFDVSGHSLSLTEAELSAPGREVSYIAKAKKFVTA